MGDIYWWAGFVPRHGEYDQLSFEPPKLDLALHTSKNAAKRTSEAVHHAVLPHFCAAVVNHLAILCLLPPHTLVPSVRARPSATDDVAALSQVLPNILADAALQGDRAAAVRHRSAGRLLAAAVGPAGGVARFLRAHAKLRLVEEGLNLPLRLEVATHDAERQPRLIIPSCKRRDLKQMAKLEFASDQINRESITILRSCGKGACPAGLHARQLLQRQVRDRAESQAGRSGNATGLGSWGSQMLGWLSGCSAKRLPRFCSAKPVPGAASFEPNPP